MRIWDINPGYLNRQSLLGEHRELHGLVSIMVNNKTGYSKHPETLRWLDFGWALRQRHQLLKAEMELRGYNDRTPVDTDTKKDEWPGTYIDEPFEQFKILDSKYESKEQGRIPLPKNAQQLWSHHKYSVLARDQNFYKSVGPRVSRMRSGDDFSQLAKEFTEILRTRPSEGDLQNALQHMWGHVSDCDNPGKGVPASWPLDRLLTEIQTRVNACKEPYLQTSTALSELKAWIPGE